MIKLIGTHISYHIVWEGENEDLLVMMYFRLEVDEIGKMVSVDVPCSTNFFWGNHKAGKDKDIVKVFNTRFVCAILSFIHRRKLDKSIITDTLLQEVVNSIEKSVEQFAERDTSYVIPEYIIPKNVYVVYTEDWNGETTIEEVFSTKEKADAYANAQPGGNFRRYIDEYRLK